MSHNDHDGDDDNDGEVRKVLLDVERGRKSCFCSSVDRESFESDAFLVRKLTHVRISEFRKRHLSLIQTFLPPSAPHLLLT